MIDTVSEALRPLEVSDSGAVASLLSDTPWSKEEVFRIRGGIARNEERGLPLVCYSPTLNCVVLLFSCSCLHSTLEGCSSNAYIAYTLTGVPP